VQDLAATVIRAVLERTGLPQESVDDVLLGHCYPTMEVPALGRVAALDAGLPVTAAGIQLDRRCGSGLQAVLHAALQVQTGAAEVVLAGGAESIRRWQQLLSDPWGRFGDRLRPRGEQWRPRRMAPRWVIRERVRGRSARRARTGIGPRAWHRRASGGTGRS
jgi:acetyl-CoA acetyltransferase